MYKIVWTRKIEKSLKKIKKSGKYSMVEIKKVVKIVASGKKLSAKYKDHKLHGQLSKLRECHIRYNLLLVYKKDAENLILILIDIGDHDDLYRN